MAEAIEQAGDRIGDRSGERSSNERALAVFRGDLAGHFQVPEDAYERLVEELVGRTRDSFRTYISDYRAFARFAGMPVEDAMNRLVRCPGADREAGLMANAIVLAFRNKMAEEGLKANTINRRLSALRNAVRIARDAGICCYSITVRGIRMNSRPDTRGPGLDVLARLFAVCDADQSPLGIRDGAMLRLLYLLGFRRIELCRLKVEDLIRTPALPGHKDPEVVRLLVLRKGKVEPEAIAVEYAVFRYVDRWFQVVGRPPRGPMFFRVPPHKTGARHFDVSTLNKIITARGLEAGFSPEVIRALRIRPHGIRHTSITDVVEKAGAHAAKEHGGHKDMSTTLIYDDNLGRQNLIAQRVLLENLTQRGDAPMSTAPVWRPKGFCSSAPRIPRKMRRR